MLTPEELEAASERLAALRADPRTPAVVRRAFLPPACAVTPRTYMQLEQISSPLAGGSWPMNDPEAMAVAVLGSWSILFGDRPLLPAEQVGEMIELMAAELVRAFSTTMPTKFPSSGDSPELPKEDSIGWIPRLMAEAYEAGLPDPFEMPLDQLFVLLASSRVNAGAEATGRDYRERLNPIPVCGNPDQEDRNGDPGHDSTEKTDQEQFQSISHS